jgi:hypothetical protein
MKRMFQEISPVRSDPVIKDLKHSLGIKFQPKMSYGHMRSGAPNQ